MSVRIIQGDALLVLRTLPDECAHMVCTSPPYWGLRDYDVPPSVWGGDPACEHQWGDEIVTDRRGTRSGKAVTVDAQQSNRGSLCGKCGAWRGGLGLEPRLELFIEHLITIFSEVRRVLRGDGVLWLNLSDSYAADDKWGGVTGGKHVAGLHGEPIGRAKRHTGLKSKDLCMVPARVAMALQADGWHLRHMIPWVKSNGMPESVEDRPTKTVEYVFLLAKSRDYFYDRYAVLKPLAPNSLPRTKRGRAAGHKWETGPGDQTIDESGANRRDSDWFFDSLKPEFQGLLADDNGDPLGLLVNTHGFAGAHFASFPPALVKPMILASTSAKGACAKCGAPWERIVEREAMVIRRSGRAEAMRHPNGTAASGTMTSPPRSVTVGWRPRCDCATDAPPVPCTVMDPFGGTGTTGLVAQENGCDAILIELNPAYIAMAKRQLAQDVLLLAVTESA